MDYYLAHRGNIEQVFRNSTRVIASERATKYMEDKDWSPATIRRSHLLQDTGIHFHPDGITVTLDT